MPEGPTSPWPESVFDFAFFPVLDERLDELAKAAEEEDWTYQRTPGERPYPVLYGPAPEKLDHFAVEELTESAVL